MRAVIALLALVFASTALAQHSHSSSRSRAYSHSHSHHAGPPPMTVGLQGLDVYRDGDTIHVLTVEQIEPDSAPGVWHRRSDDAGRTWSEPVKVDAAGAAPFGMRPGNDAQVAARGARVVALWSVAGSGWGGSGPFALAISDDGGRTWRAGPSPSDSASTAGHAFADLLFTNGGLEAVWLDGRDKAQGLRYSRSTDSGASWSANTTVAAQTCECCWNTLAANGDSLYVLYRGKGPRDMSVAMNDGKGWHKGGPVAAFGWDVKACPETGGGLAVTPDGQLHALAWTGQDGKEGLYYASLAKAGGAWSSPRRLGTSEAQHADLAANRETLLAAWDETVAGRGAVRVARLRKGEWEAPVTVSSPGSDATHPRVVAAGNRFVVFWGERTDGGPRRLRSRAY